MRPVVALAALSLLAGPAEHGPALVLSRAPHARAPVQYSAAALVLVRGIPEREVLALADAVEAFVESMIARAHPLYLGDDDVEPDAALRAWLGVHSREITSAIALVAPEWQASDGFTVRFAPTCPSGEQCVDLHGGHASDAARRARFLAWPVSHARVVRTAAKLPQTNVAMALTQAALDGGPSAAEERVRDACARLTRLGVRDDWVTAMTEPPPRVELPLVQADDDVLLVPDVAAIGDGE